MTKLELPRPPRAIRSAADVTIAQALEPMITAIFNGPPPVAIGCWDGSWVPAAADAATRGRIELRSPDALRYMVRAPGELGLARAFVTGTIDVDGNLDEVLDALQRGLRARKVLARHVVPALRSSARLGILRPAPAPPPEEARLNGRRHTHRRDAQAIAHHYDVSNAFYHLVLGPSMTYSCAVWDDVTTTLEAAQAAKHDLVCRKLGLHHQNGLRLLDVGCGWGTMAIHAARTYGARVLGVTISTEQYEHAQERVKTAGVDDLVELRIQDYREIRGERFDAISSIGMFEHVGRERVDEYFATLSALLETGGRLLNHAISRRGGSRPNPRSFIGRYVFPDGELFDVGDTVNDMERAGFEVRDVEVLREHYARTLRAWIVNLRTHWDDAVAEVGERRARIWHLYMAACAVAFDHGGIGVNQILGVKPDSTGRSTMALRRDW